MTNECNRHGLWAATPLIVIVILIVLYAAFLIAFIRCDGGYARCRPLKVENVLPLYKVPEVLKGDNSLKEDNNTHRALQTTRYSGRITWGFLMVTYMLVSLAAIIFASGLIYKIFADWGKRSFRWALAAPALSAAFGFTLYQCKQFYMPILEAVLNVTVKLEVEHIVAVMNGVNSTGLAAAFALVLASCAILLPSRSNSSNDGLRQLSKRMNYLRSVLYVGTLVLVVGVLLMKSIFQWSLAFIRQPGDGDAVEKIVEGFTSSIVAADAGFYTLLLAAVYLPAAFILQWRARSLKGLPKERSERDKVLHGHGLTFSFKESFPRIVAILGPFLAGPVSELIKNIPTQ